VKALVLAAHGSRRDPSANAMVRRLAESVRSRRLFHEVAVAFHQGEPGFEGVLDELASDEVTVVPLMTSAGHYSDVVLPAALAKNRRFEAVRLRQTPPVGTHPGIAALLARRVSELLRDHGLARSATSLLLVGHGTRRHPASRTSTLELADTLRRRRVAGEVLTGFVDDDPPVAEAFAGAGNEAVLVLPFLVGGGTHVLEDIPRALGLEPGEAPLVIHGGESGEFWRDQPGAIYLEPDDLQRRLACFRDHRFLEIPGAGHMVHFDRPRELVTAIRQFLADEF
jgi:sirohydrochlorin cobaltochelatase